MFHLAAEQGLASAQLNIGMRHYFGEGVQRDYHEAAQWFRLAAEQGNTGAQYNLGLMYGIGNGVSKDLVSAHIWFNISHTNGADLAGEFRDDTEKDMTREQIAEATRRAKVCMASDYQDCD